MNVKAVKTHRITTKDRDLLIVLDRYIKNLKEGSIVVIVSKIVAITQGRVVKPMSEEEKDNLIKSESQKFIPKEHNKYGLFVTIVDDHLTYSAGIDESNADGMYVLWPENPGAVASKVRKYLRKKFRIKKVGVIITDMIALPMRWGVIYGEIAWSGFAPLKDLTGKPDIFGREFRFTKVGILNGLAAAAGVVMGEGSEQTPIGIITDIPFVEFSDRDPTDEEIKNLIIKPENDIFGSMITSAPWKKGGKNENNGN